MNIWEFTFPLKKVGEYQFVDQGDLDAPVVLMLHGIVGDVDNWQYNVAPFVEAGYRVLVPWLPCYKLPRKDSNVMGVADWVHQFLLEIGMPERMTVAGNSLGGQVALHFVHRYPKAAQALILAGSSGIRELALRGDYIKRNNDDFIRSRAGFTFYRPEQFCTEVFMERIREITSSNENILGLLKMAKSSMKDTVTHFLPEIQIPTLIVWGKNDQLTLIDVAEEFQSKIPNTELHVLDECGHSAMLEQPEQFNALALNWLSNVMPAVATIQD